MDKFIKPIEEYVKEKLSSPFYVTFIISWCLWNWEVFYITFFVDSDLLFESFKMLKIEYIDELYLCDSFWTFVWCFSRLLILPLLSASLIVFVMPYLTILFYDKSLETDRKQKFLKEQADKKLLEQMEENLKLEKAVVEKKEEIKEIKEKSLSEEEKWGKDYEEFRQSEFYKELNLLLTVIYEGNQNNQVYDDSIDQYVGVNPRALAYFDSIKIIEIKDNKISLTDKGRYFIEKDSVKN